MSWLVRVIPNRYADSVRLMGVAHDVRSMPGVSRCEVAMGTAANLEALAAAGVDAGAGPADVVIAVEAADRATGEEAARTAEERLAAGEREEPSAAGGAAAPRSLPAAAAQLGDANVALISVPGEYATLEADKALARDLHVFLFSDHVPVEDELDLKRRGAGRGLLVMGPECGTAMLGGVGLGFANAVRRGPVGIVSAGGTGAQEAACLLDAAGVGVSHIVGVGGRDLGADVGGIMFREGIRALAADDETETLLLVAKTPAAEAVRGLAGALPGDRRVVAAFVGADTGPATFEVHSTIEAGALAAAGEPAPDCAQLERAVDERRPRSAGRRLLGLYSGGSLAHEAITVLEPALGPIAGNVGHGGSDGGAHTLLDLGEQEYTRGRPHPMVDLGVRLEMLADAAEDERLGCLLLDVVLGYGAHADPAGGLAAAIARVAERATVLVRVCGTHADPQDADRQEAALREAGAVVAPSNAAAARLAVRALEETGT